jgi:excisionase family DNA binding protein
MRTSKTAASQRKKVRRPRRDEFVPLMDPNEVAKWLGVSSGWVRDHATRKTPRLPAIKIGKLLRFQAEDIREFIEFISEPEAERQ